jgi:Predicted Fe-S oxidoreductases
VEVGAMCGCGSSSRERKKTKEGTIKQETQINPDGSLPLSEEVLEQLGITAGSKVIVSSSPSGLSLRNINPALSKIYIEPTNTCNLNCRTCIRHTWKDPVGFLKMETYIKLLEEVSTIPSITKISFWGFGEPLLHPNIVEMIARAKTLGLETQLITNGLLLDLKMAKSLVAANLDSIVVSIDGSSEETQADVRSGADLNLVKKNIKQLRLVRYHNESATPEIGIEFVAMKSNVKELGNIKDVACELGANFIFVTNVLPYSSELKDEILYWQSVDMKLPQQGCEFMPKITFPPMDNRREEVGENLFKISGPVDLSHTIVNKGDGYCRFVGEGSLVISWDGEVSPCAALMHAYSCYVLGRKKDIKRYTVGNIEQDNITDLWDNQDFTNFRERVQRFDFAPCTHCGGCEMAESNEEDCYDNTFPVCGDCLWAQGVIQCP